MRPLALALVMSAFAAAACAQEFSFKKAAAASAPEVTAVQEDTSDKSKPTPPPQKDPDRPNDSSVYMGDISFLTVLQKSDGAALYCDGGSGMKSSPRHYYFTWVPETGEAPKHPLLVFVEPSDGHYPSFPQAQIFIASKPAKWYPADEGHKGMPMQVWRYPKQPTSKGLFALVSAFGKDGKPKESAPLMWWGLSKGQDLETISSDERKEVYKELGD